MFVTTGDFNADGILDLTVANQESDSVSVLLGNGTNGRGNGTFAAKRAYAAEDGPRPLATADFNSDGILDLAVTNLTSNSIAILLGQGDLVH